jgi:HAD superfamily hydrolase (TIGR01459 family)
MPLSYEAIYFDPSSIVTIESINKTRSVQVFSNLESICEPYNGILLDAYGVFWGGNDVGLLPGCKATMERLMAKGKIIGILSNSTQLAENEVEKLKKHDLIQGRHFHFFITSGSVAKQIFLDDDLLSFPTSNKKFYVLGASHPKFLSHQAIFQDTPFQETADLKQADFIYISIPHIDGKDQTDPAVFKDYIESVKDIHLPIVCVNPDRFAHEGNPPKAVVRQGSIAFMLEEQGSRVSYIGKPSDKMYAAAMKSFFEFGISNPQKVLMVGDTPETDIRGAKNFGMPSALIAKSGIMADRIAHEGLDILQNLPKNDFPDFFIEYMAQHEL